MQRVLINHRSPHHGNYSGYDILTEYIGGKIIPGPKYLPLKLTKYIIERVSQEAGIYDSISVLKDWELLKFMYTKLNHFSVVHYLAAERDVRFGAYLLSNFKKIKLCGTFHKPTDILKKSISDISYLKKLNGAIAVGLNQVDFLKEWLNIEHVKYIPHGVDTVFFHPDQTLKRRENILFVGQHLRDFAAFNYAVPRLIEKRPDLKINVVLREDAAYNISPHNSITIYSDIDDFKLRDLYQEASLLFLPLKDATACNALLEAMACGLPIVTTDLEGSKGYVKNYSGVLVPSNDYMALVETTLSLLENEAKLAEMGLGGRQNSLDFDWKKIAIQIDNFYHELFD